MGVKDEQREQRGSRGGGSGGRGGKYRSDSEFVNYELSAEETAQQRRWRSDLDDVSAVWGEVLEEGYRVNTKWDDYSSAFAAFIIPDERSDNAGYILTGRGGTPYRAVAEALFKHRFSLPGGWATYTKHERVEDDPEF